MNKLLALIVVCLSLTFTVNAQKAKVVTASTLLSEGEIADAKKYIEEAFSAPEVETMVKAWVTKGDIYSDIYKFQLSVPLNVPNPLEIAEESYLKAYELDKAAEKKAGKYLDRIQAGIFNTSIGFFEVGAEKFNSADYETARKYFDASYDAMVFMEANKLTDTSNDDANIIKKDALTNGALCALNLSDYPLASEYYERLIDLGGVDEKVYANLASIYIVTGKFEEAKVVVDKGRAEYPDNESLKESELNYFIATGKTDQALGKLEAAIEADPTDPDLYFNIALAYEQMDQEDKMIESYEKIMDIAPDYHAAYLNLGAYYNEKANTVIKKMNEMNWKEAMAFEPERDKWYNMALPYLEKAYELTPDDENVQKALERIYANLNMLEKIEELRNK